MIKIPLTYTGFDGTQKTKDFHFNLTKAELTKISLITPGGFDGFIERLKDNPEPSDVLTVFENLILTAYGKRTPDNKYVKSKELSEEFAASDAYSELFLKFFANEDNFAMKFIEGATGMDLSDIQAEELPIPESSLNDDIPSSL